jgi:hypothetical protein
LLEKLNAWIYKLKDMESIVNVSLLIDADNREWCNTLHPIHDSFVKLDRIVGNRGYWIRVKKWFGRSEEVYKITSSVEKKINILAEIHKGYVC